MTHDSFPDFPYRSKLYFWSPVYLEGSIPPFPARDSPDLQVELTHKTLGSKTFPAITLSLCIDIPVAWREPGNFSWNRWVNQATMGWYIEGIIGRLVIWCAQNNMNQWSFGGLKMNVKDTVRMRWEALICCWRVCKHLQGRYSRSQHATVDPFFVRPRKVHIWTLEPTVEATCFFVSEWFTGKMAIGWRTDWGS